MEEEQKKVLLGTIEISPEHEKYKLRYVKGDRVYGMLPKAGSDCCLLYVYLFYYVCLVLYYVDYS